MTAAKERYDRLQEEVATSKLTRAQDRLDIDNANQRTELLEEQMDSLIDLPPVCRAK
jgi:septation ring formation regulator EzrA